MLFLLLLIIYPNQYNSLEYCHKYTQALDGQSSICTSFNNFLLNIPTTVTSIYVKAKESSIYEYHCEIPLIAKKIVSNLKLTKLSSINCNGNIWHTTLSNNNAICVGGNNCNSCNSLFAFRPCLYNVNWGGSNLKSCFAISQELCFGYHVSESPTLTPTKTPSITPTLQTLNPTIPIFGEIECCPNKQQCSNKNIGLQEATSIKCCKNNGCTNTNFIVTPFIDEIFEFKVDNKGFNDGSITAGNVIQTICKQQGCINSVFNYNCFINKGGCKFECIGYQSCKKALIGLNGSNMINCNGDESCINSGIVINGVIWKKDFYFNCMGFQSCKNSVVELNVVDGDSIVFSFKELESGENIRINIKNNKPNSISISLKINCVKDNSCNNMVVTSSSNINILDKVNCEQNACHIMSINGVTKYVNAYNTNYNTNKNITHKILGTAIPSILGVLLILLAIRYLIKMKKTNGKSHELDLATHHKSMRNNQKVANINTTTDDNKGENSCENNSELVYEL